MCVCLHVHICIYMNFDARVFLLIKGLGIGREDHVKPCNCKCLIQSASCRVCVRLYRP